MDNDSEMENSPQNDLPQDRWYWGWYGIFLSLVGIGLFIPKAFGIPCFVIGLGGLLIQMRQGFKQRLAHIHQVPITRAHLMAFLRVAAVVMLIILGIKTVSLVFEIKTNFDKYITPRTVTAEQADKLKEYLSKRDPGAVTIAVVENDPEALEYTGQLFNALRETNWDINPPNHGGPNYFRLPRLRKPMPNDLGSDGKPLYQNSDQYLQAHDDWLESEIERSIAERTYPDVGLGIHVDLVGQPQPGNPDPKHPSPDQILQGGLRYAGIPISGGGTSADKGKYAVLLLVGHRPRQLVTSDYTQSVFFKVGRWIMELGR